MQRPHALSLATPSDEADGGPPHMEHTRSDTALPLALLASADSPRGPSEEPSPLALLAGYSWLPAWQWGEGSTAAGADGGAPTLLSSALVLPLSSLACCTRHTTSACRARGNISRGVMPLISRRSALAPAYSRARTTPMWLNSHAECRGVKPIGLLACMLALAPADNRVHTTSVWP